VTPAVSSVLCAAESTGSEIEVHQSVAVAIADLRYGEVHEVQVIVNMLTGYPYNSRPAVGQSIDQSALLVVTRVPPDKEKAIHTPVRKSSNPAVGYVVDGEKWARKGQVGAATETPE
jgi:hypothetical protein